MLSKSKLDKIKFRFLCCISAIFLFAFSHTAFAQFSVSGSVDDTYGESIPGVNILLKGTLTGTTTDVDGKFNITVSSENDVLVFSYIGFITKEVTVGNQRAIKVVLAEDAQSLEEVIVMGYTIRKRSEISGSVATVSSEKLTDISSKNVSNLLQGKIGGVVVENTSGNPNTSSNVTIRGNSSISSSAAPLQVVDGIVGGIANPSDIKSVTVLKDAASTALYGARAANGVIVIETYSGSTGGKTQVNFSATLGSSNLVMGPVKMANSKELYEFHRSFMTEANFAALRPESLLQNDIDWTSLAYRTGIMQDYVLTISGGNDKTQFYISGNYYHETAIMRHVMNSFVNLRVNLTHNFNDKLKLDVRINAQNRNLSNEASGSYGALSAMRYMPWDSPYNSDGSVKIGTEAFPEWTHRYPENFLHSWQYNWDKGRRQRFNGDITLTYRILPNLTFASFNRANYLIGRDEIYYDARTSIGRAVGELWNQFRYNNLLTSSNRLSYDLRFDKHALNLLGVYEWEETHNDFNGHIGEGFLPGIHVMSAANTIKKVPAVMGYDTYVPETGSAYDYKFAKMLLQADYNFDYKYFIVASIIREGSSRFGIDNQYGNFYTFGASWMMTNEKFMKSQDFIDLLKLRLSYGKVGNAGIGNYEWQELLSLSNWNNNNGLIRDRMGNPSLTWEKTILSNLGIDISLFNKRIDVTFELYNKVSDALLYEVPKPWTEGFNKRIENVGAVRNRGFEFSITTVNVLTRSFRWETMFNTSHNQNRVVELYGDEPPPPSGNYRLKVGHDRYEYWMREWAGVDPENGDPLWRKYDQDANGNSLKTFTLTNNYNEATLQHTGKSRAPLLTGGLSNDLYYKDFSLKIFINYVYGNTISGNNPSDGQEIANNVRLLQKGESRWEKPGDIATDPKPIQAGNKNAHSSSTRGQQSGNYIRLRTVQLGYNIPTNITNKIKIERCRIFVSGENLFTITKYRGQDPENTVFNSSIEGEYGYNFQQGTFGTPRRMACGISLTF